MSDAQSSIDLASGGKILGAGGTIVYGGWQAYRNHRMLIGFARKFATGRKQLRLLRQKSASTPLYHIHKLAHHARKISVLATATASGDTSAANHLKTIVQSYCDTSAALLACLTEDDRRNIHACIKIIHPDKDEREKDLIRTYERSSNAGSRDTADSPDESLLYAKNYSTYASVFGIEDGCTRWKPLRCFSCPDLSKELERFKSSRQDWKDRYNSTLVIPIQYPADGSGTNVRMIGFMAFDSLESDGFRELPNAFEFSQNPAAFDKVLLRSPIFDAAAIASDMLGNSLSFAFENARVNDVFLTREKLVTDRSLPIVYQDQNGGQ